MKKRVISIFLICIMCLSLLAGCKSSGNPVSEARNGVVRVLVTIDLYAYDRNTGRLVGTIPGWGFSQGSSFGVGKAGEETDIFVTNRHVVVPEGDLREIDGVVYYCEYHTTDYYLLLDSYAYNTVSHTLDASRAVPFTVIYVGQGDDEDLAVLKAANPVPGRVALPLLDDEDSLEVHDKVSSLGYPSISDTATSENFLLAGVGDVTVNGGDISRFFDSISAVDPGTGALTGHLIQHNADINQGNSGGPLVDENGAVVGINTYTVHGGSQSVANSYYALRVRYAKDALDSLRIEYDTYPLHSGLSPLVIGLIAAAAVLVIIVVVVVVMLSKRKQPSVAPPPVVQQTSVQPPVQPPVAPATAVQPPPASPVIAGDTGLRIQGVTGRFASRRFAIAGTLRIGRDPARNDLVYPADSQGVSGVHCSLTVEGGRLLLRDLGSTYGTFVGGNRLAANATMELRVGDRFCLGSERETFVVARKGEA